MDQRCAVLRGEKHLFHKSTIGVINNALAEHWETLDIQS